MKQPIIQVENLVKTYSNGFKAVKGVSFEVNKGEVFGLLGPNGAGKTTTLEIIESLRDKTSGTIRVDGEDLDSASESIKSKIGIQLQSAGFYPSLSLVEILNMFGVLFATTDFDPYHLLDLVGLKDKAKSKIDQLSGGQKQRFSIATTLVNQPSIIFLDEPTTGLDPQARMHLWDLIRSIQKKGTTIVLTTHYMDEAEQLCDRLAIMNEGVIVAEGTPNKLVKDLLATGFKKAQVVEQANLEDVFLSLTGKALKVE